MKNVFTFNFVHPKEVTDQLLPESTINSLNDIQSHILDSIENLNTSHIALQVLQKLNRIRVDHDPRSTTNPCEVHQQRFY